MAMEEELKGLNDQHQAELMRVKEEAKEKDQVVEDLKKRLMSMAADATCKARAELFKEYLSGVHASWYSKKMQDEVDAYEEMEHLNLEKSLVGADIVDDEMDGESIQT